MGHKNKAASFFHQGTLRKSGHPYSMRLQTPLDIDAILALQDVVMDDLSEEEQVYVVPKDRAFFEKHFAAGGLVLGVFCEGRLVAQSVIVNPTKENPKTGMTDMPARLSPHKVTVIQGVIVHPDLRGNRLMTVMVDAWLDIARRDGRCHAIAEVASENHFSWKVFMKEGLQLHSIGYDAEDAVHLYNMHARVNGLIKQRLKPEFNAVAPRPTPAGIACDARDLSRQKDLLKKGFRGIATQDHGRSILFERHRRPLGQTIKDIVRKCPR